MSSAQTAKDRTLIAVIGDEVSLPPQRFPRSADTCFVGKDSITGLLLAGIGHVNQQSKKNFLTVEASESLSTLTGTRIADGRTETPTTVIEAAFQEFTERPDIAILLINQHVSLALPSDPLRHCGADDKMGGCQVADKIRGTVDRYQAAFPALLEIPSKDFPYGAFDDVPCRVP